MIFHISQIFLYISSHWEPHSAGVAQNTVVCWPGGDNKTQNIYWYKWILYLKKNWHKLGEKLAKHLHGTLLGWMYAFCLFNPNTFITDCSAWSNSIYIKKQDHILFILYYFAVGEKLFFFNNVLSVVATAVFYGCSRFTAGCQFPWVLSRPLQSTPHMLQCGMWIKTTAAAAQATANKSFHNLFSTLKEQVIGKQKVTSRHWAPVWVWNTDVFR